MNGQADASYKFGAGRFLMQQGLLEEAGAELAHYGKKPFVVGGPTAISLVQKRLTSGLQAAGMEGAFSIHPGHVYHEAARQKAQEAREAGCDMVVAAGGGRAMDFGKLVAYYLGARVICMPTSISTCAAYSPFSLIYTPEGRTIPGNFCYEMENAALLVDLDIMAAQPARYVVSGMLDAMGKFVEIKNGHTEMPEQESPLALYAAYLLARYSFEKLQHLIDQVLEDIRRQRVSSALEDMVFLNIPLTGIISGLSRGVGQSAIAHDLYYQTRYLFPKEVQGALHGEIVGLGILPQLYYNGEPEKVEPFRNFLKHVGAPTCLTEIGFPLTQENYAKLYESMAASIFVGQDAVSRKRFADALSQIAQ